MALVLVSAAALAVTDVLLPGVSAVWAKHALAASLLANLAMLAVGALLFSRYEKHRGEALHLERLQAAQKRWRPFEGYALVTMAQTFARLARDNGLRAFGIDDDGDPRTETRRDEIYDRIEDWAQPGGKGLPSHLDWRPELGVVLQIAAELAEVDAAFVALAEWSLKWQPVLDASPPLSAIRDKALALLLILDTYRCFLEGADALGTKSSDVGRALEQRSRIADGFALVAEAYDALDPSSPPLVWRLRVGAPVSNEVIEPGPTDDDAPF